MKIGLFTSVFFNNIGNAFIDLGVEEQIKAAIPKDAEIIKLSQCANFAASLGKMFAIKESPIVYWLWIRVMQKFVNQIHDKTYRGVSTLDVLSPARIAKMDYLIIPGCVLTVPFFVIFGRFLEEKQKQGCKLIFWAASGNYYTTEEQKCTCKWLEKLKPHAISFRDSVAYNHYHKYCDKVFNGIDNVFFVNRIGVPKCETTMDPYVILNFDLPKNNNIRKELANKLGKNIIYTDHKPYPYSKISKLVKKNIICSDYPLDYLFLYNNVTETYSDRVHACIPTLSFGNKARIYSDSPRIALFENVGINLEEMKSKPISLDQQKLYELQENQISFLKKILI